MIKDKNDRDLTEAEDIKERWQEYTQELYQEDLDVLNNLDSVVADTEPDILDSEVKWALESMANNMASGGDGCDTTLSLRPLYCSGSSQRRKLHLSFSHCHQMFSFKHQSIPGHTI